MAFRLEDSACLVVSVTPPEVILTWMPAYVAGGNHSDHQASDVIATEAFDLGTINLSVYLEFDGVGQ